MSLEVGTTIPFVFNSPEKKSQVDVTAIVDKEILESCCYHLVIITRIH